MAGPELMDIIGQLFQLQELTPEQLKFLRRFASGELEVIEDHKKSHKLTLDKVVTRGAPRRISTNFGDKTEVSLYLDRDGKRTIDPDFERGVNGKLVPRNRPVDACTADLKVNIGGEEVQITGNHSNEIAVAAFTYAMMAGPYGTFLAPEEQRMVKALFLRPEGDPLKVSAAEALLKFSGAAAGIADAASHEEFARAVTGIFDKKFFMALRQAETPVEIIAKRGDRYVKNTGLTGVADYLNEFWKDQETMKIVLNKSLVETQPTAYLRGGGGAISAPEVLMKRVLKKKLGIDLDGGDKMISTNYFDPITQMPVTVETCGILDVSDVALGVEYTKYWLARLIFHSIGMDAACVDSLQQDLPPGRRKAEFGAGYVSETYESLPAGQGESLATVNYGSLLAEKAIPLTLKRIIEPSIDKNGSKFRDLRAGLEARGEWVSVFGKYSLPELQKAVIERVMTRVTVGAEDSQWMDFAVWGMITKDVDSRKKALVEYGKWMLKSGQSPDIDRSIMEMEKYFSYMERENPFSRTQFLAERGSGAYEDWLDRKMAELMYDKSMIVHRRQEARRLDEMKLAWEGLLPAERAVLKTVDFGEMMTDLGFLTRKEEAERAVMRVTELWQLKGDRDVFLRNDKRLIERIWRTGVVTKDEIREKLLKIHGSLGKWNLFMLDEQIGELALWINKKIIDNSKLTRAEVLAIIDNPEMIGDKYKGYDAFGTFLERMDIGKLDWDMSNKDPMSWVNYNESKGKSVDALKQFWRVMSDANADVGSGKGEVTDVTLSMEGVARKGFETLMDEQYQFVPSDEKSKMAVSFILQSMQIICPLDPKSWMIAIRKKIGPKSERQRWVEMYLPEKVIADNYGNIPKILTKWGYRTTGAYLHTPGKYSVRARVKNGDASDLFEDMYSEELKEKEVPMTVLGLQVPHKRLMGYEQILDILIAAGQDSMALDVNDVKYIKERARELFNDKFKGYIMTKMEKKMDVAKSTGDAIGIVGQILAGAIDLVFGSK